MLVFIDDSGDPGFKVGKGSSKTFVIASVIFDDELEAEKIAIKIKELRRELTGKDAFEFRFNKCRRDWRCRFLSTVAPCKFKYRAIIFPKKAISSTELKSNKESFYNYAVKTLLKYHDGRLWNARLRLDGHGTRELRKSFSVYLRRELNKPGQRVFQDLKFRDSEKDVLIQLAEMIAGSIRRYYDAEKDDHAIYRSIILKIRDDEWVFGSKK